MNEKNLQDQLVEQFHRIMRFLRRGADGERHRGGRFLRVMEPVKQRGEISTRELAEVLDVRPSSLNEMLARLEQDGMISRSRDPKDQRVFLVRLTESGEAQLARLEEAAQTADTWLTGILTQEEAEQLIGLCQKLGAGLEARAAREHERGNFHGHGNPHEHHEHREHHGHHGEEREDWI